MVKIQLIEINEGYLDVSEQSLVPLNFSVSEIRKPSEKKGSYSKTITLSGTKNNNILLNNYFEVNIVSGSFNLSKKQPCIIIQDGVVILDNASLQLLNVKINENDVTYEVAIKDTSADFFSTISGKELTDLDFTDLNHVVNPANVIASFTNTYVDGYKYGLGNNLTNVYNMNQLMPCVYAKTIFDRIFQNAGYTYDFPEFQTVGFDKLLLPYVGEGAVSIAQIDEDVKANRLFAYQTVFSQLTPGVTLGFLEQIIANNELIDDNNYYNPATGVYATPYDLLNSDNLNVNVSMSYELIFTTSGTAYLDGGTSGGQPSVFIPAFGVSKNGNTELFTEGNPVIRNAGFSFTSTSIQTTSSINATIQLNQLLAGDLIRTLVGVGITQSTLWKDAPNGGNAKTVNVAVNVTAIEVSFVPNLTVLVAGATVNANSLIPVKTRQSEFINSIAQLFNVFISPDKFNSKNLILKTRDNYYDNGKSKDWTKKIAKDREQQISFLSDISSKKYLLTYKQDSDQYNEIYKKATNEIYGQIEYTFDSEFVKDTQKNELIFSPTPIGQTIFGAVVPYISYPAPKINIRVLFDAGINTCGNYSIGGTTLNTYPLISHTNSNTIPTLDINFGICDYYFVQGLGFTNNNLFNLYWRRTLGQINNGKLLSALFDLNQFDINTLDLSDKIHIENTVWNINKIIDYDASSRELTRVELISVDEESSFIPFLNGNPTNVGASTLGVTPIDTSNVGGGISQGSGNNNGTTGVTIGNGNVNTGGVVVGDNNNNVGGGVIVGNNNTIPFGLNDVLIVGNGVTATANGIYSEYINGFLVSTIVGSAFWEKNDILNYSFFNKNANHVVDNLSVQSAIVGGNANNLINSFNSAIVGGSDNTLTDSFNSVIIGGGDNTLTDSFNSVIIGGVSNEILNADNSVILGGQNISATLPNTVYQHDSYRSPVISITTVNNTTTNLHTFVPPSNGVYIIESNITGFEALTGAAIGIKAFATFKVIAGVVTQISTTTIDRKSNFPASVEGTIDTDGINIRIRVKGRAGSSILWKTSTTITN